MQFVRHRLIQEIEHGRVIRIFGGTDITLRLIKHKVARAIFLSQRTAIKLNLMFRVQFKRGVTHYFTINGDTAGTDFTARNSAAHAKLLRDKFIESH
ncbi:hypothetical protein D3C75_933940 [compost metagenome]